MVEPHPTRPLPPASFYPFSASCLALYPCYRLGFHDIPDGIFGQHKGGSAIGTWSTKMRDLSFFFLFDHSLKNVLDMVMCIDATSLYVFVSRIYLVLVVSDFSNVPSFTSTRRNCNFTWMMNQIMPCTNDHWKSLPSMWQRGLFDSTCVYRDSPKPLNNAVLHGCLWLIFMCLNPPFQLNKNQKMVTVVFHHFSSILKTCCTFWDHGYPPSFGGFQV